MFAGQANALFAAYDWIAIRLLVLVGNSPRYFIPIINNIKMFIWGMQNK